MGHEPDAYRRPSRKCPAAIRPGAAGDAAASYRIQERDAYRRTIELLLDIITGLLDGVAPAQADWQNVHQALGEATAFGGPHD